VQVVQAQLAELAQRLAGLTNKQQALQGRFTDTQNQIAACQQVLLRANEVANGLGRAHADRASANRKVGEANQKVASCQALELKTVRLVKQLNELRERKSLLKDLRESFGKNGVPAMIIEVVLPELEVQTNSLLSRMTSGRMGVRFETQREAKSGNVSETLEIRISDELGERPYEMYSGGEAFRINFAIRIALSKLLAHRQGARLQTLFIDEGFGTQDAQGRERLVEAIQAIQDDFERLIIITHLDDLKDAFPARIEVTKTANGSTARIV
jgi:exonuclease SbcC